MAFGNSATLSFDIFAYDHASGSFVKIGNAAQRTGGQVAKAGGMFGRAGDKMKYMAKAGALAVAAGSVFVAKYGVDAVKAASDLNETISKSNAIFGDNAANIQKWAGSAARSMGLSKQAALDSASSFGDMFSQIGFAGDQAAAMSKRVTQMAVDFGSFNNLPTEDVLDRISGAFRGEYDALQKVIPNISAARVQQVALTESGKASVATLTAQEKAHAVLTIMQKDGARAMGDFERTSGGLANQQKILGAQLDNVKAKIGTALLPVAVKLFTWMNNDMIPAAQRLWGELKSNLGPVFEFVGKVINDKLMPFLKDVGSALGEDMPGFVGQAKAAFKDAQPYFAAVGTVFSKVVGPAVKWLAEHILPALGLAIRAVGKFWRVEGKVFKVVWENLIEPAFDAFGKAIKALGKVGTWLWNNVFQPVFKFIVQGIATVLEMWSKMLATLGKVPGFGWAKKAADAMALAADKANALADDIKKIPNRKDITIAYHYTGLQNGAGPTRGRGDDTMPGGPAPRTGVSPRTSSRGFGTSGGTNGISVDTLRSALSGMQIRLVGGDSAQQAYMELGAAY